MRKNRTVMSAVLVMMMEASWSLSVTPVASASAAEAQTALRAVNGKDKGSCSAYCKCAAGNP